MRLAIIASQLINAPAWPDHLQKKIPQIPYEMHVMAQTTSDREQADRTAAQGETRPYRIARDREKDEKKKRVARDRG